ncbi:hypothetical protein GH714_044140 [Hevea brasiliensis]|uniref:Uncharacterized protein n=1 Tax=Hevea brasiliensis TaxID=3981 RepID=A0A6A6K2K9_HEVBR|nr:hypothetical protein GH714_044140 [Hevea brasiliensis]
MVTPDKKPRRAGAVDISLLRRRSTWLPASSRRRGIDHVFVRQLGHGAHAVLFQQFVEQVGAFVRPPAAMCLAICLISSRSGVRSTSFLGAFFSSGSSSARSSASGSGAGLAAFALRLLFGCRAASRRSAGFHRKFRVAERIQARRLKRAIRAHA